MADIDDETKRLNRVVTDVLDFARPIRFELAEADLNEICRASVAATWTGAASDDVTLDLDPRAVHIVTDAERLRTALVNVLTNARHAVHAAAQSSTGTDGPAASVPASRRRLPCGCKHGWPTVGRSSSSRITARESLRRPRAHLRSACFTTRRAGTGLGLPIAKNIVEGLGGSVSVSSRVGHGTEIRIDLQSSPHIEA